MKTVNKVNYTGSLIDRKSFNNEYDRITVISKNGKDVFVSFLCRKEKLENISRKKVRVNISGHIETHAEQIKSGAYVNKQHFYVDSIEESHTILENSFGVKGKFYPAPNAEVYIAGKLSDVRQEKDWYRYTVVVDDDVAEREPSTIVLSQRKLDRHPDLKAGDSICCVCSLSTPQKKVGDNIVIHYEDLIVSDLAVVA